MKTDTSVKILEYIRKNGQARPDDIGRFLGIGQVAVHRQLKRLIDQEKLEKIGNPPLVFYTLPVSSLNKRRATFSPDFDVAVNEYINENYLYVSPQGEVIYGVEGFKSWALLKRPEINVEMLAQNYFKACQSVEKRRSSEGWIDATDKLKSTFPDNVLSKLLYGDFYSIPEFGKTKLGSLVLYAKQSQSRALIDEIAEEVRPLIMHIIEKYKIDTVGFIPPSIPRRIQFMKEFKNYLGLNIKTLSLVKTYKGDVIVAQKTLSDVNDRIANAKETIFPREELSEYMQNVLLIDDAVGSGATLNETGKKLLMSEKHVKTIVGFAVVGSIKGFEVLREV